MRPPRLYRLPAVVVTSALFLFGCQENREITRPELARVKPDRTLTVTGGGTGSGKVTAPQVFEVEPLLCAVEQGRYDPTECTKSYPWKSSVVLTAEADTLSTFTGWSGACTGTAPTCKVTMTQARSVKATFGGGGLPEFVLNISGSGTGSGTVRSQTGLSPAINCSITSGTATGAGCSASYQSGTAVTLTATTADGHVFTGWSGSCSGTGTCSLTMSDNHAATAAFSAPAGPEATFGRWDAPTTTPSIPNTQNKIIGLHLSQLRDGRVLMWGHGGEPYTWNPAGGVYTQKANTTCDGQNCELFCAGHTFLADGRLLTAGGHNETLGDGNGLTQASTFDGDNWSPTARMRYGRWYPTLVTLGDGQVVAISGSQTPGTNASVPERYNGSTWTQLTSATLGLPLYPRAFVEPKNGWIFYAGESASRYLDPAGTGTWTSTFSRRVSDRSYGSAVMLDSKVLYVGGGGGGCPNLPQRSAEMIDLLAPAPTWALVDSMEFRRRQTNATILPDGQVLVTGGTGSCGFTTETGAVYAAEAYNPETNQWTTWSNATVVRVYHSTATLLPDGRVLVTGSGDGGGVTAQPTQEIFSPPYLFKGPRPTYTLGSSTMRYGQVFTLPTPNASAIRKVTIIRLVSTTHAFDMGQRLNKLSFTASADGTSLTLTPPAAGRFAPPGPYLLFIVDQNGVPSVGQTILLGP
jgi:hypothetical protein